MPERPPLLELCSIGKSYAAPVLRDVDFTLRPGEVHALLGANGAGKTTLSRIISGLTPPDAGTMKLAGAAYQPAGKQAAEKLGVQIVMQELSLVPNLSVAENLFLNHLPRRWGMIRFKPLEANARTLLHSAGLPAVDPQAPVRTLGVGQQQLIEIAKALSRPCRILILDEPTAALTDPQIAVLFKQIARLKEQGVGIVYISHRMAEVRRIADRATILRDGQVVANRPMTEMDHDEIVRLMVGETSQAVAETRQAPVGAVVLRVEGLSRGTAVRDVSLEVCRGEILGVAGLIGSGRTELLRAIFGADRADAGRITVVPGPGRPPFRQPGEAVRAGIGLIPEDRKLQGLLLTQALVANCTLGSLSRFSRAGGWLDHRQEYTEAGLQLGRLATVYRSLDQPVAELSGGNQQKVLMARWLMRACAVLLLDEPTRGIDVAAKRTIYDVLRTLAAQGKGLLVVSSDLQELLDLCDRIAVMSAGRLVAVFKRGHWSEEAMTAASFQGYRNRDHEQALAP